MKQARATRSEYSLLTQATAASLYNATTPPSTSRTSSRRATTPSSVQNASTRQPTSMEPMDDRSSSTLRKELDLRLSAYLPAVVRRRLERQTTQQIPDTHQTTVVSMFADVSGFTAMTESLAARGPVGAEFLGRHLNSYFEQLLRLISSAGGDVFKFAGDAMLVFWSENKEDTLESLLRRCVQCALRIQSHLHQAELAPGVVLSVKMGIGIGGATIAHLGGVSDGSTSRIEYIAVGPALEQAFSSEHQAEAGDVICSPDCWKIIAKFFDGEPVRLGSAYQKVKTVEKPIRLISRRSSLTSDDPTLHDRMKQYVSRAVWPYLDAHDEFWGSELRDVTVLFINLGFCEEDLAQMLDMQGLQRLQDAFALVQKCIYEYEGTINKFLVDDKGSTVIAAFGLPPVTHENDPIRGILSSLAICAALGKLGLKASVGITTGVALCGVVGHQGNRREYTVLGDIVNLSARLMQKAKSEKGGVITDETTKLYTHDVLHFEERPEIMVKGKNDSIKIHRPYPRMSILLEYHLSSVRAPTARKNALVGVGDPATAAIPRATPIPNVMDNMHRVQVRDAQRRISLLAEKQAANTQTIIESDGFQKIRDTLLQTCSQLNRFSNGGSFILEGDIGVGKTVLLRNALSAPTTESYNVYMGTASPFVTRKPYALWAEIITKCALESYGDTSSYGSDTDLTNTSSTATVTAANLNDFSRDNERRSRIATFVRRKIRDGAAPNTTLVRYAYLLNGILDTNFEEFIEEEETETESHESSVKPLSWDTKQPTMRGRGATRSNQEDEMTSPSKFHMKEEDIAAWFLGLLEMDLASRRDSEVQPPANDEPETSSPDAIDDKESPEDVGESKPEEKESEWKPTGLDLSGILLLCALHAMSRDRATVFCLDNAMFMDEKSWVLTTIIAKYFTNCMVVVGTRPPSLSLAEHTQSSSFRKQLRALKRMKPSVAVAMEPLGPTEIHKLAMQFLKVQVLPDELSSILISRCQGNPLFLYEIIGEMLHKEVIKVDESRYRCFLQVQEPWGEKHTAHFCFHCYVKFANSKEKHRCKSCGYVFCMPCTPKACRKKLPGSTGDPVRHCSNCYTLSSTRRPSADRSLAAAASTVASNSKTAVLSRQKSRMRSIFHLDHHTRSLQPSLNNRIALRPPKTVKSVLTTLLDQLTVSQRMLMKTASVIGSVFEEELLRDSTPIRAHLSRFHQDMEDLERLSMIRRIDNFIAGVPTAKSPSASPDQRVRSPPLLKVKYEFCHGFMQDVIRSQMLCSQLDKLNARISDCREQQQKELRHRFFEKAKDSLNRPVQITIPVAATVGDRRRGSNPHSAVPRDRARRRSLTSIGDIDCSQRSGYTLETSSSSYDDSTLSACSPRRTTQTIKVIPTFVRLKTGMVFVKKQSSLFSHLKFRGLTNARLWKKRFAVLQNARLMLHYDEANGSKPRPGTTLFLKGAKVSACDPEVASKVNCFQVEVNEWTKGKYLMNQKRFFVMGVQSEAEVENWVYMIRYAIESLENQTE
ncbi:hypothetical protein Poli38472_008137 [Pythium oligandrum]|uniref:Adenylate cyclase n=1 Tax=Pythium oligandrum TaxID=41045 RepID=A0A8K1CMU8_PYTOL|nr:hypothetical protein Poli38472_008137 [Pythium oligandrum]|eukprot:TMW65495.1 hypothetical protein Poli38472_008137 [Pythium oligandrum]